MICGPHSRHKMEAHGLSGPPDQVSHVGSFTWLVLSPVFVSYRFVISSCLWAAWVRSGFYWKINVGFPGYCSNFLLSHGEAAPDPDVLFFFCCSPETDFLCWAEMLFLKAGTVACDPEAALAHVVFTVIFGSDGVLFTRAVKDVLTERKFCFA